MIRPILVVGDVMTDIIVLPEGPLVKGSDRRAKIRHRPGGSGANQAVWLGAMHADVRFVARVGAADLEGYQRYFSGLGVAAHLVADPALPSGVLVTIVDPDGERSFLTDRGANLNLCAADIPDALLEGVGLVLVSGYSFFAEGPRQAVMGLFAAAKARGIPIAVDPASVGFLQEVGVEAFLGWTAGANWLFANQSEAEALCGAQSLDAQMRALGEHYALVVIKQGAIGAAIGGRDGVMLTRAAPAVIAIDTTGAGDAFAAGFLAAHLAGAVLDEALQAGVAAGSKAVQTVGGQPA